MKTRFAEAYRGKKDVDSTAPYAAEAYRRLFGKRAEDAGFLYYPNRFDKQGDCDDKCDGTSDTGCQLCPEQGVYGDDRCWKNSFRSKIKEYDVFLQVVEKGALGLGQKHELRWAMDEAKINPSLEIVRVGEPGQL